jgi:hypothetical protein
MGARTEGSQPLFLPAGREAHRTHPAHLQLVNLYWNTCSSTRHTGTRAVTLGPPLVVKLTLTLIIFRRLITLRFGNCLCLRHQVKLLVSMYLWLYSPLLGLGCFFSFLNFYIVGRTRWTGISPSQGRYMHTGQHKYRINAHRYPCLKWDWNPRSQCVSGRRQLMP